MLRSKKEALKSKGWRFGNAQEFLGLSREEAAYVELRLRLADSLRRRRRESNLSQTALAKLLRSSQSRIAKMEGGDPSVSLDLLIRSLLALGTSNRDLGRTISAATLPHAGRQSLKSLLRSIPAAGVDANFSRTREKPRRVSVR